MDEASYQQSLSTALPSLFSRYRQAKRTSSHRSAFQLVDHQKRARSAIFKNTTLPWLWPLASSLLVGLYVHNRHFIIPRYIYTTTAYSHKLPRYHQQVGSKWRLPWSPPSLRCCRARFACRQTVLIEDGLVWFLSCHGQWPFASMRSRGKAVIAYSKTMTLIINTTHHIDIFPSLFHILLDIHYISLLWYSSAVFFKI